jgi:hypothetical protein
MTQPPWNPEDLNSVVGSTSVDYKRGIRRHKEADQGIGEGCM